MSHHYHSWYAAIIYSTQWRWIGGLALACMAASVSLLKPDFIKQLISRVARWMWRTTSSRVSTLFGRATPGIYIAGHFVPDSARLMQTLIQGVTGAGKTVLMVWMILEDLKRGVGMVIIDAKGDRELYNIVLRLCKLFGREKDLHYLSATHPKESVRWNPCRFGTPSEVQSKWLNSGIYSEPFYASACELALNEALHDLNRDMPDGFTLKDLLDKLKAQIETAKNENIRGLYQELANFGLSEWGPLLCAPMRGETEVGTREVAIDEIVQNNQILFVDLPTEGKNIQSARMGKLLLQELVTSSGRRKAFPEIMSELPYSVYIDEFDAFASESFTTFLNKGRSSNFMIHMAYQTISDLKKVSETFAGQLLGLCNVEFTFRLNNPEDCDLMASAHGTKSVTKETYQTQYGFRSGVSSNRETQEFNVHPNDIKGLPDLCCFFSIKSTGFAKKIRIQLPSWKKGEAKEASSQPLPPTRGEWRGNSPAQPNRQSAQGKKLAENYARKTKKKEGGGESYKNAGGNS